MDLPLIKAEPIRRSLGDSVVKRERKVLKQLQPEERGMRICENSLQTPRSVQKKREEVLQVPELSVLKTMVRQVLEVHGGAESHGIFGFGRDPTGVIESNSEVNGPYGKQTHDPGVTSTTL
ncbi:hypothetical protein DUI87_15729 [Hirundo rustica rustica]|uniref:Uncharacterized protein n=1 Tax=Hirundo rustica rustica TaxID=333673 RepID=A0A3M0K019_HIRRU|nr:hypothetical protein DUI87_15729 [Hirundo rustica rustica]